MFFLSFFLDVKTNYKRTYLNRLVFQIHRLIQIANQRSLNAQGAVAQTVGWTFETGKQSRVSCATAKWRERES